MYILLYTTYSIYCKWISKNEDFTVTFPLVVAVIWIFDHNADLPFSVDSTYYQMSEIYCRCSEYWLSRQPEACTKLFICTASQPETHFASSRSPTSFPTITRPGLDSLLPACSSFFISTFRDFPSSSSFVTEAVRVYGKCPLWIWTAPYTHTSLSTQLFSSFQYSLISCGLEIYSIANTVQYNIFDVIHIGFSNAHRFA